MADFGERVRYDELAPHEAGFLHPQNWGGQVIGLGNPAKRGTVSKFEPLHRKWDAVRRLVPAGQRMQGAIERSRHHPAYAPIAHFGPGEQVVPAELLGRKGVVVFDQSTLLTRGEFMLDIASIPEDPPFRFPEQPQSPTAYYMTGPHMHYLREPSPVALLGKGDDSVVARASQMELHVGLTRYYYQVGALAVPETVTVDSVQHLVLPDGNQMLTRTHNIFVFPDMQQVLAGRPQPQ